MASPRDPDLESRTQCWSSRCAQDGGFVVLSSGEGPIDGRCSMDLSDSPGGGSDGMAHGHIMSILPVARAADDQL